MFCVCEPKRLNVCHYENMAGYKVPAEQSIIVTWCVWVKGIPR